MPSLQARLLRHPLRWMRHWLAHDITSLQRQMQGMERYMPRPGGVTIRPVQAGGVPGEWVIPDGSVSGVLLYFHGGGFVVGSPGTHRALVAELAKEAGMQALSLDYRLAPEHPFPAALEDCVAAYHWLIANGTPPEQIVLGGDSAGGNLVLATLLRLRELGEALPAAAVCLSPVTDLTGSVASRQTMSQVDPILPPEAANWLAAYTAEADPAQPLLSPLFADLRGLPPLLLQVGTLEILYDDSRLLAEKARLAGVDVTLEIYPGLWHVFQMSSQMLPEAKQAVKQLGAFIAEHSLRAQETL